MPLLRHTMAHLGVEQTPTGRRLGLTNARLMALAVVETRGECSMSQLARELGLSSPLATRVADGLVARRLAERLTDPDDRRRVLLRVTASGHDAVLAVHAEAEEIITAVLMRMTRAETESLLTGLHAFLRALHEPAHDDKRPSLPAHEHDFPTEADT